MDYTSNCFKSQIKTKLSLSNVRFIPLFNGGRKEGGGGLLRDEVQALVLLQRSQFLEDLAILDNNTDYRTWEMTEWNYQKRYIYWYMFYLSDKRWRINFKMKIKVFVAHRKETYIHMQQAELCRI